MWVKICGNTNLEDAAQAASLGADAVGFIFAPSKRQVTAEQVAAITPHLPPSVEHVGVFTTSSAEEIARAVQIAHLTAVQLHGALDRNRLDRLQQLLPGIAIIPAVHWSVTEPDAIDEVQAQLDELARLAHFRRIHIDAKVGALCGGTGVAFDWNAARPIFRKLYEQGTQPILAGGLRPQNVAEAIRLVEPWGVDVSSGVESTPGHKDPAALAAFLAEARRISGS